jgi:hypothetical protein
MINDNLLASLASNKDTSASAVRSWIESQYRKKLGSLAPDEDLLVAVLLHNGQTVQVTHFSFAGPNLVIVEGFDGQGQNVTALMAHTSIQVVMTVVKRPEQEKKKPPLGFSTAKP